MHSHISWKPVLFWSTIALVAVRYLAKEPSTAIFSHSQLFSSSVQHKEIGLNRFLEHFAGCKPSPNVLFCVVWPSILFILAAKSSLHVSVSRFSSCSFLPQRFWKPAVSMNRSSIARETAFDPQTSWVFSQNREPWSTNLLNRLHYVQAS